MEGVLNRSSISCWSGIASMYFSSCGSQLALKINKNKHLKLKNLGYTNLFKINFVSPISISFSLLRNSIS